MSKHDDDENQIGDEHSLRRPTRAMGAVGPTSGSQPRFENISSNVVLRSDVPTLGSGSIIGSYRVVQQIGIGGMAAVFEANHSMLPRRAAIKVLHHQLRGSSGMDNRLIQEATILDQLQHAGVPRVFDCGLLADGRPWIAMELIAGESLAAKLTRDMRLSLTEVCNLIAAVADVLATAHARGIVHRDLKPENLLFAEADSGFPLRVIDWGVAHVELEPRLTLAGETCGTPIYMSPEQAAGHHIAPPCDIYSLGVIAYEALAGVAPYEGRTLAELSALHLQDKVVPLVEHCPAAPPALCDLIHVMLAKDASQRPSAPEVRQVMQRIALELVEVIEEEHALYEITATPAVPRPRWTPQTSSMMDGSGYMLVRPQRACDLASGEIKRKH
jgi:eukaryotic-like serine/threonine-protein kinase